MKYQEPIIPRRKEILISIHSQQCLIYFSKLSKRKISEFKLQGESPLPLIKAREKEVLTELSWPSPQINDPP